MLKSMIIAFSTYSRIPMPRVEWEENSMKYSMCFFPLVGAVLGGCSLGVFYVLRFLGAGKILAAALLTVLPLFVTGGIHMDGFLDTMDAKNSYKSREEKLNILKDPHIGGLSVLQGIIYLLVSFALFSEAGRKEMIFVALGYVYSRILSGLSVVTLKRARADGMAASTAKAAGNVVKWILLVELFLCMTAFFCLDTLYGGVTVLTGIISVIYYKAMAYRIFGGITGDLAGYFLQVCELAILAAAVLTTLIMS